MQYMQQHLPLTQKAFDWLKNPSGENLLTTEEYCPTRDVFQSRLSNLHSRLRADNFHDTSLLVAVIGEIGNNAYDHNLGNWRDVPGAYFVYDIQKKVVILADRGQGIRQTINRVKPEIVNDTEALRVAFTEVVSGRYPEQRGNGLKFVRTIVQKQHWRLDAYSGNARLSLMESSDLEITNYPIKIKGTIMIVSL